MALNNLGAAYANQLLRVVLNGETNSRLSNLSGKTITVVSVIIEYKGKPEIIVENPTIINNKMCTSLMVAFHFFDEVFSK